MNRDFNNEVNKAIAKALGNHLDSLCLPQDIVSDTICRLTTC